MLIKKKTPEGIIITEKNLVQNRIKPKYLSG